MNKRKTSKKNKEKRKKEAVPVAKNNDETMTDYDKVAVSLPVLSPVLLGLFMFTVIVFCLFSLS